MTPAEATQAFQLIHQAKPEDRLAILRDCFKESLYFLCKYGLGYKDVNHETHGELIDALEAPTRNKLIVMPRGTLKSSVTSVGYPIWTLIKNPNARIFIDSEVYDNSKNFIREIRQHLEKPLLTVLFGNFRGPTWSEGELVIAQRTHTYKEPSVMAIGSRTVKVGQHCDVLIHDDMNSEKNSHTPEHCQKVVDHYKRNKSILERKDGISVVVATRYAANDIPGHIIFNELPEELKLELPVGV